MNPDDPIHPWLLPHLPGFGADATSTRGLMPRPGVDPAKLRALLQQSAPPMRSIGAAPQAGLPAIGTDPHDVGNLALGDVHALVRNLTGLGGLEDKLAVRRGGMTKQTVAPHTVQEQLDAEYGGGDPLVAAAMPAVRAAKPAFKVADDGLTYFEHYSPRADLTELDPAFMGTAKAGAERKRAGRVPMMHVYAPGAKPEPMFRGDGFYKYAVPIQNPKIYDIGTDPAGIVAKLRKSGFDADKMERAIEKAGYDGYHNSEYYPATVKLFGKRPVQPFGVPSTYAILTAENPGGTPASAAVNRAAQAKLLAELKGRGFKPVPAKGQYPEGDKLLTENSLLVPGMTKADALAVGKKYGQNSVITNEGFHDLKAGVTRAMGAPHYTDGSTFTQLKGGRPFVRDLNWDETAPFDSTIAALAADPAMRQRFARSRLLQDIAGDPFQFNNRLQQHATRLGVSMNDPAALDAAIADEEKTWQLEHMQAVVHRSAQAPGQYQGTLLHMGSPFNHVTAETPEAVEQKLADTYGIKPGEITRRLPGAATDSITNKIAMLDAQIRKLQSRPGNTTPYTLRGLQHERAKAQIDLLLAEHIRNRDLRRGQLDSLAVRGVQHGIDDLLGPLDPDYTDHYDPRHVRDLRAAMQGLQRAKTPTDRAWYEYRVQELRDMSPQEYAHQRNPMRNMNTLQGEMSWLDQHIAAERAKLADPFSDVPRSLAKLEQRRAELELDHTFSEDFKNRMARYHAQDRLLGGSGLFR